jgi:hypothetical protein
MKKTILCLVMLVALLATPVMASAQLLPGLPGLPGMPAFNLPSNVSVGNLSLYGAWVTNAGMTNYTLKTNAPAFGNYAHRYYDYDFSSLYVAGTLPISMGDFGAALFSVSFTVPSAAPGHQSFYFPNGVYAGRTRWNADTFWGTVEGVWSYPLSENFNALAGFRWESWQTSFKSPVNEFNIVHSPTDPAFLTVNGYLPFVGLLATYRGLNFGVIGIPTFIGEVEHRETIDQIDFLIAKADFNKGYFLEIFGDYTMPMPGSLVSGQEVDLSLFGKCTFLEAHATPNMEWWQFGALFDEGLCGFRLYRNLFFVGAKATWNFNLAGLLPF